MPPHAGLTSRAVSGRSALLWAVLHIKRRGQYPARRLLELHKFVATTPLWRVVVAVVITPLPSLLTVTLFKVVHLRPPSAGLDGNRSFYVREFVTYCVLGACLLQQVSTEAGPAFPLSKTRAVAIAMILAAVSTSLTYLLALTIGFPVPFTMQMCAPSHLLLQTLALIIARRAQLLANPSAIRDVPRGSMLFVRQASMILVYPVYYYAFTLVPEASVIRLAFLCLLPVLKVIDRQLFCHVSRKTESGVEYVPLLVVFNADVMGCLFTAFCMQYKPSVAMAVAFAVAKLFQALLLLRQTSADAREVLALRHRVRHHRQAQRFALYTSSVLGHVDARSVVDEAADVCARDQHGRPSYDLQATREQTASRGCCFKTRNCWFRAPRVVPIVCSADAGVVANRPANRPVKTVPAASELPETSELERLEREYADGVRELLYVTEFTVLVEYVEVVVPSCTVRGCVSIPTSLSDGLSRLSPLFRSVPARHVPHAQPRLLRVVRRHGRTACAARRHQRAALHGGRAGLALDRPLQLEAPASSLARSPARLCAHAAGRARPVAAAALRRVLDAASLDHFGKLHWARDHCKHRL